MLWARGNRSPMGFLNYDVFHIIIGVLAVTYHLSRDFFTMFHHAESITCSCLTCRQSTEPTLDWLLSMLGIS